MCDAEAEDDWWREKAYETAREKLELQEENTKLTQGIKDLKESNGWEKIPVYLKAGWRNYLNWWNE